jgi:hypothetical protein
MTKKRKGGAMPPRSKLEIKGLVDRAYDLFQHEKKTAKQIADILTEEGYLVSKSGVARALRRKKLDMRRFEEAMESAKAIVKATEGRPGTDIGEATLQLTLTKLLDELRCIEDFRDMDSEQVVLAVARISRSIAAVSRLKLDYERGYKAGLFRALRELENRKAPGTPEEIAKVLRDLLAGQTDGTS